MGWIWPAGHFLPNPELVSCITGPSLFLGLAWKWEGYRPHFKQDLASGVQNAAAPRSCTTEIEGPRTAEQCRTWGREEKKREQGRVMSDKHSFWQVNDVLCLWRPNQSNGLRGVCSIPSSAIDLGKSFSLSLCLGFSPTLILLSSLDSLG